MKNPDQYPLHVIDFEGNVIEEHAIQFILSLSPPIKVKWEDIENIFVDDYVGRSYYYTRQLQLDACMETSIASGQYKLYTDIYRPANKLFVQKPPLDTSAMDNIASEIDAHMLTIKSLVIGSFHPCNPSDMLKLESIKNKPEHNKLMELCSLVQSLDDKRIYKADNIKYIPRPIFEPDITLMQSQVLSDGYFVDSVGKQWRVPDLSKAKSVLSEAIASTLPALKLILDKNLRAVDITKTEIIYLSDNETK